MPEKYFSPLLLLATPLSLSRTLERLFELTLCLPFKGTRLVCCFQNYRTLSVVARLKQRLLTGTVAVESNNCKAWSRVYGKSTCFCCSKNWESPGPPLTPPGPCSVAGIWRLFSCCSSAYKIKCWYLRGLQQSVCLLLLSLHILLSLVFSQQNY